jgi:hypothetical protein
MPWNNRIKKTLGSVHGFQGVADPGGVAGRAGRELVGGGAHLGHDVVDAILDLGRQRDGPHGGGLGGLEESREAAQVGHRVAGLPHHVVHRRRRAAVEPALPVVQHGAPDAAARQGRRHVTSLLIGEADDGAERREGE